MSVTQLYQELWGAIRNIKGAYIAVGAGGVYIIGLPEGTQPPPIVQQCVAEGKCKLLYFTTPPRLLR